LVRRYTRAGYWSDISVGDLLGRCATQQSTRDAVIDVRQRLTY
jgi:non-ribosomal peptide synthetase component E (peptide arylation enzyme)